MRCGGFPLCALGVLRVSTAGSGLKDDGARAPHLHFNGSIRWDRLLRSGLGFVPTNVPSQPDRLGEPSRLSTFEEFLGFLASEFTAPAAECRG